MIIEDEKDAGKGRTENEPRPYSATIITYGLRASQKRLRLPKEDEKVRDLSCFAHTSGFGVVSNRSHRPTPTAGLTGPDDKVQAERPDNSGRREAGSQPPRGVK
ncbi:Hypothetical protein SMAX5B_017364 [Scophthalmus maximus]|uniref:Uncharacterized protein n=1 Tax=Scophthalmus maximus TaxID=52904 RepID=A0A2U9CN64_SCOMX|nr:Hypothetical protein SMAX5B_017364 [Scophthalmus maximus]